MAIALEQLKTEFFELVHPELPNDWDVEEAVEALTAMDRADVDAVFSLVGVIWPVSNSLCFSYLSMVEGALQCIGRDLLPKWVGETLDHYEQSGLKAAQQFMQDVKGHFVCRLQGSSGLRFAEVEARLLPYVRGLLKRQINLGSAGRAYSDGATLFLPEEISTFPAKADNFLLYKLIASFQWGYLAFGTLFVCPEDRAMNPSKKGLLWLEEFFAEADNPGILTALYHGLETLRVRACLERELPGLMRDVAPLLSTLAVKVPASALSSFFTDLNRGILGLANTADPLDSRQLKKVVDELATPWESVMVARQLYDYFSGDTIESFYHLPLVFQGELHPDLVAASCLKKRNEQKNTFVEALATLLLTLPSAGDVGQGEQSDPKLDLQADSTPEEDGQAVVMLTDKQQQESREHSDTLRFITMDNQEVELNEELIELANDIAMDLGEVPEQYIASAAGLAGKGSAGMERLIPQGGQSLVAPITYDEWDFRRSGFRRNWCSVIEKEIPVIRSTFLASTLEKYHGQIIKLRHQFEMMRTRERFVRRQRDGDDIDLDALVESLADTMAGQPPSDRLFIRLQRDERDIAALFLVDMSNSTRGWVGTAIKEAMVLICEAMESLGDRYAIYGFSGMRRLRCEVFPLKLFSQPYDDEVREKIGSIAPREYTRMAPAIRHMTSLLTEVEAKVRLLITLSDGKPEDYDEYKGEYAIEDTRHALVEAKMAGIHPFCITIDQHAHEYMAHMYGEVNYIFIDDVRKLPLRMPEIYRVLTS